MEHPEASVSIEDTTGGKRVIVVEPKVRFVMAFQTWETAYSLDLIAHVLQVKGPADLCDEIMRDEDPLYVQHALWWDLLSYVAPDAFAGRRVLDFGSGSGASTMALARMLPESAEIVGVELGPKQVELARHRARFYGMDDRVRFHLAPDHLRLPAGLGSFDFMVCAGVYQCLRPDERRVLLPLIWSHLVPGGVLFLNQTGYRWFPIERGVTGLPLLNYLPDRLALACARRFAPIVGPDEPWSSLLRRGIRGATTREILRMVHQGGQRAELLTPSRLGVTDPIDLWYRRSSLIQQPGLKQLMRWGVRAVKATTGLTLLPTLALALRKRDA